MNLLRSLLSGPSPFKMLKKHMDKVMECVDLIEPILDAALRGEGDEVKEIAQRIFLLEHEADEIKNTIRDAMPRELLMPVSRIDFLAFLRDQDSLADKAEDLAMMLGMRPLHLPKSCGERSCEEILQDLAHQAVGSARTVAEMTRQLNELSEAGFKGSIVDELRELANEVGEMEWRADKQQFRLLRSLLREEEDNRSHVDSYVHIQVVGALGELADHAERMSDSLRLMLAE